MASTRVRRAGRKAARVLARQVARPVDPHVQRALQYARDVTSGKVPACLYVRQACQRQLDDLAARDGAGVLRGLYTWDEDRAGRVCRFIERLPHIKGPRAAARELIVLEPWQCFIVTTVFGWRRVDTGGRRFRRAYIEVPRGNAKSTLSSGVGLYGLAADDEEGPEVYAAATKKDQARIVWDVAKQMMEKRPEFASLMGVVVGHHELTKRANNGKFVPLSRESGTQDGLNTHIAVIDELHAHRDRGTYDVIETSLTKRFSSLLWVITTAGSDTSGICYEVRGYVIQVLGGLEDDSQFGIIYTLDEGDDWQLPENWVKANPNWGVSVMPDAFTALAQKAMKTLSAQNNFKTKHLDIWCNADIQWMDMRLWDRCADRGMRLEELERGEACYVGLDLATKIDIASKVRIFKRWHPRYSGTWDAGAWRWVARCREHPEPWVFSCGVCYPPGGESEAHYYVFSDNFLPETAVQDGRNSQYEGWALEGVLTETPGEVLDFTVIKVEVRADLERFNLREVVYDPWQATQLAQELENDDGAPMTELRATVANYSEPMKELQALVMQRRWHHTGSPVDRWMVSNVVCHTDAKDNVYPRKTRAENKIDYVVACIMALNRALLDDDPYESGQGLKTL